jgi:hypothetical protein
VHLRGQIGYPLPVEATPATKKRRATYHHSVLSQTHLPRDSVQSVYHGVNGNPVVACRFTEKRPDHIACRHSVCHDVKRQMLLKERAEYWKTLADRTHLMRVIALARHAHIRTGDGVALGEESLALRPTQMLAPVVSRLMVWSASLSCGGSSKAKYAAVVHCCTGRVLAEGSENIRFRWRRLATSCARRSASSAYPASHAIHEIHRSQLRARSRECGIRQDQRRRRCQN